MIWPKRFKMDKAASAKPRPETGLQLDVVHLQQQRLLVSDGDGAAVVPWLRTDQLPSADLPRLQKGEHLSCGPVPLQAVREAAKGKTGEGTLRRAGAGSTRAQAASGKPWLVVEDPMQGEVPNFDTVFETTQEPAPASHRYVEVCLDAERLARIAAAIGAEEAVKLRFLVNEETGRADAAGLAHGIVDIRPIREPEGGGRGVLMIHVVNE